MGLAFDQDSYAGPARRAMGRVVGSSLRCRGGGAPSAGWRPGRSTFPRDRNGAVTSKRRTWALPALGASGPAHEGEPGAR